MNRRPKRWWEDRGWWDAEYSDQEEARDGLYRRGAAAFWHLPTLAFLWLRELNRVGLTPPDASSGAPAKQPDHPDLDSHARPGDAHPARLEGGKFLWLRLDGRRTSRGYKNVELSGEPLMTDVAIIAALTALEVSKVNEFELKRLVDLLEEEGEGPLNGSIGDHVSDLIADWRKKGQTRSRDVQFLKSLDLRPFEYCLALLRDRYLQFDDLPRGDQLGLLSRAFSYISPIVDNARKLVKFLEYGSPEGLPTRELETAEKSVKAALLKDVVELSLPQMADELGITKPPSHKVDNDVPDARKMANVGRKILRSALRDEGWQTLKEAKKAEMRRWRSLSKPEKKAELEAELEADLYDYEGWPASVGESIRRRAGKTTTSSEEHSQE